MSLNQGKIDGPRIVGKRHPIVECFEHLAVLRRVTVPLYYQMNQFKSYDILAEPQYPVDFIGGVLV